MGTHQAAELRLDGCEAAGLDLDQQIVSNDIDDKPADRDFESISLPCVPLLEGCVEGFLIQQTDSWHLNPNPASMDRPLRQPPRRRIPDLVPPCVLPLGVEAEGGAVDDPRPAVDPFSGGATGELEVSLSGAELTGGVAIFVDDALDGRGAFFGVGPAEGDDALAAFGAEGVGSGRGRGVPGAGGVALYEGHGLGPRLDRGFFGTEVAEHPVGVDAGRGVVGALVDGEVEVVAPAGIAADDSDLLPFCDEVAGADAGERVAVEGDDLFAVRKL